MYEYEKCCVLYIKQIKINSLYTPVFVSNKRPNCRADIALLYVVPYLAPLKVYNKSKSKIWLYEKNFQTCETIFKLNRKFGKNLSFLMYDEKIMTFKAYL